MTNLDWLLSDACKRCFAWVSFFYKKVADSFESATFPLQFY